MSSNCGVPNDCCDVCSVQVKLKFSERRKKLQFKKITELCYTLCTLTSAGIASPSDIIL